MLLFVTSCLAFRTLSQFGSILLNTSRKFQVHFFYMIYCMRVGTSKHEIMSLFTHSCVLNLLIKYIFTNYLFSLVEHK